MTEEIKVTLRGAPGAEANPELGIKGSALTYNEIDNNFEKLRDGINQLAATVDVLSLDNNTNNITEGSDNSVGETALGLGDGTNNLFYTNERVQTYLTDNDYADQEWVTQQISVVTTDELGEGTNNLFYTNERVQTYLTDNDYADQEWVTQQITVLTGEVSELTTTDGISEGLTNLYYTDERVRNAISVEGDLAYDPITGVISYTDPITIEWSAIENTPTTVAEYGITDTYTQAEVNAAITERVTEIASGEINLTGYATETYADQVESDAIASAEAKDVVRATAATAYADQVEVDAKAYTDTRETAITTAYQTYADAILESKTTDDLGEGTSNLYYTDSRVQTYLTDNNFATKLYVTSAVNDTIFQTSFATVATSGSYNDLEDTPTDVSAFINDTNFITLDSISVSGDLQYNNATGVFSYTGPTNVSELVNDASYLVGSDLDNITDRLDVLETPVYTIFDLFKHMYDGTGLDEQYLYFSIRAIDQFRYIWLSSGQSDPTWDTLVDAIYDNDTDTVTSTFMNIEDAVEQALFLTPFLAIFNAELTIINNIENTTYDTMTFSELLDIAEWESRNLGFDASATAVGNQLNSTDDEFIRAWLKANSYADFKSDTIITGWNPA